MHRRLDPEIKKGNFEEKRMKTSSSSITRAGKIVDPQKEITTLEQRRILRLLKKLCNFLYIRGN